MESKFYAKEQAKKGKIYLTWKDFDKFIQGAVAGIPAVAYKGIYAIPRGGLVLGVVLSHALSLPLLQAPCDGCLIVDDIADTGAQLKPLVRKFGKNVFYVVWYINNTCKVFNSVVGNFYAGRVKQLDEWIVFPWEA